MRRNVTSTDRFDEIRIKVWFCCQAKRRYVEASQSQDERCKQANSSRSRYGGAARFPHAKPSLNLVGLRYPLLDDSCRLQQDADFLEPAGDLHDELHVVDVVFGEITMPEINPTFEI